MTPAAVSPPTRVRPPRRNPYSGPTQVDSSGTSGMVQVMGNTATTASAPLTPSLRPPREALQLPVAFHGSGSTYFRIWIVDLLLTALTLTLYRPWARIRALRYFYDHTRIQGHPLEFDGDPWLMLRRHVGLTLLVLGTVFAFGVPLLRPLCAVTLVALWPALLRSGWQFSLARTRWRGLPFAFLGSLRGAYLLFALPAALGLAVLLAGVALPEALQPAMWAVAAVAAAAAVPCFWWLLKSYQHDNLAYGHYRAELRAGVASFYAAFRRSLPVAAASAGIAAAVIAGLAAGLVGPAEQAVLRQRVPLAGAAAPVLLRAGLFAVLTAVTAGLAWTVARAWFSAVMQDLVWSRTGTRYFRFRSELPPARLTALALKNAVFCVATLGLYFPYARVAQARLRLQAVTLVSRTSVEELVSFAAVPPADATGEGGEPLVFDSA